MINYRCHCSGYHHFPIAVVALDKSVLIGGHINESHDVNFGSI